MELEYLKSVAEKYNHPEILVFKNLSTGHYVVNLLPYEKEFSNRPINYLEIGIFRGKSVCWILDRFAVHPQTVAYCIDPWDLAEGFYDSKTYRKQVLIKKMTKLQKVYGSRMKMFKGFSERVLRSTSDFKPNMMDLIYVDGKHRAQNVIQDWVLSWPLLKIGGITVFDDYTWEETDEVQKATDFILYSIGEIAEGRCKRQSSYELLFKNKQLGIRKIR